MNYFDLIRNDILFNVNELKSEYLSYTDSCNDTLFHCAVYNNNFKLIKKLLKLKADPNIKGWQNYTAFIQLMFDKKKSFDINSAIRLMLKYL